MTTRELQPAVSAGRASEDAPAAPAFEAHRSVLRLLVGLALLGGNDLIVQLRKWETAHPPAPAEGAEGSELSASDLARQALVGMIFETADAAQRALFAAAGLSVSVAGAFYSSAANNILVRPFTAPGRYLVTWGMNRLRRYVWTGQAEERHSRQLAGEVTSVLIADVVNAVEDNPGVKALVDAQIERLLPHLVSDATIQALLVEQLGTWIEGLSTRPESLDPLVRQVGDRYIAYLNDHPEDVQNLVQGQAAGMAGEVRDNVRTITVTGDTFLEMLARGLFRRAPRQQLPPPEFQPGRDGAAPAADPGRPGEDVP